MDKETRQQFKEVKVEFTEVKAKMNAMQKQMDARFDEHEQRFTSIDERFDEVDKKFDQIDKRFEQVDARFEQVDRRFEQIDKRFDTLESTAKDNKESIDSLTESFEFFKQEAVTKDFFIETLNRMFSEFKHEIFNHIDGFTKKYKDQDTEIASLRSGHKRHDKQIQKLASHAGVKV